MNMVSDFLDIVSVLTNYCLSLLTSLAYFFLYLFVFLGIGYVVYRSNILSCFQWYRNLTNRANMTNVLMTSALSMIKTMQKRSAAAEKARALSPTVDNSGRFVTIPVIDYNGYVYMHRLPYSNVTMMRSYGVDVYLDMENKQQIKITQLPGTVYLHSASQLGGIGYTITYQDKLVKKLDENEKITQQIFHTIKEEAHKKEGNKSDDEEVEVDEEVGFD